MNSRGPDNNNISTRRVVLYYYYCLMHPAQLIHYTYNTRNSKKVSKTNRIMIIFKNVENET